MKNHKTKLLLAVILLTPFALIAQEGVKYCATKDIDSARAVFLPWYGNNAFINNFKPYTERGPEGDGRVQHLQAGMNGVIYNIPIKAWIYEGEGSQSSTLPLPDFAAENYINQINEALASNNISIRLYLFREEIEHRTNGLFYIATDFGGERMMEENHVPFYMNIHFIRATNNNTNGDGFAGKANKPYDDYRYSFVTVTGYNGNPLLLFKEDVLTTFVHELGHTLGLEHTHRGRGLGNENGDASRCYQESVSRTRRQGALCVSTIGRLKCEVNGDFLCSTEGDPELQWEDEFAPDYVRIDVMDNCYYENPTQDRWGDTWMPMIRNYMSYSERFCRDEFTHQQVNAMYYFTENHTGAGNVNVPTPSYFYINPHIDRFENDNFWQNANDFNMEGLQFHSFHYDPHPAAVSQAETDWVQFRPQPGEEFFVATAPVQGADAPNNMQVRIYRGIQAPLFAICHAFT